MQSVRIQMYVKISSDHYLKMMLDELLDLDEERLYALHVLIRQKEQITKAYNKKVQSKTFTIGDYVWNVILPLDRKDITLGKWSLNQEG